MVNKIKYPLEQLLAIKKDRVKKAQKIVDEKIQALQREQKKLQEIEAARDKVAKHHQDKLEQIRKALDEGTTSDEILQMRAYIKVVKVKLNQEQQKVKEQKKQVAAAEKQLESAKAELKAKRLEEEKMLMHKDLWEQQEKIRLTQEEAKEQDEIGQAIYEIQKRKRGE